jgi:hypothetical protein
MKSYEWKIMDSFMDALYFISILQPISSKKNHTSWIFSHWTRMKFNGGNETMNRLYFVYEIQLCINDTFLRNYFTLKYHEILSQELWRKVHPSINLNSWMRLHACSFMEFTWNLMDKRNFECIFMDEIKH